MAEQPQDMQQLRDSAREGHRAALRTLNTIEDAMTRAAQTIVKALDDGRIDTGEGLELGITAYNLGMTFLQTVRALTPASGRDFLWLMAHSHRVIDQGAEPARARDEA
jgi:hypothetical protein